MAETIEVRFKNSTFIGGAAGSVPAVRSNDPHILGVEVDYQLRVVVVRVRDHEGRVRRTRVPFESGVAGIVDFEQPPAASAPAPAPEASRVRR